MLKRQDLEQAVEVLAAGLAAYRKTRGLGDLEQRQPVAAVADYLGPAV